MFSARLSHVYKLNSSRRSNRPSFILSNTNPEYLIDLSILTYPHYFTTMKTTAVMLSLFALGSYAAAVPEAKHTKVEGAIPTVVARAALATYSGVRLIRYFVLTFRLTCIRVVQRRPTAQARVPSVPLVAYRSNLAVSIIRHVPITVPRSRGISTNAI